MAHPGEPNTRPLTPQCVLVARQGGISSLHLLTRGSVGRPPMLLVTFCQAQPRTAVSMKSPMSHAARSVSRWTDVTRKHQAPWGVAAQTDIKQRSTGLYFGEEKGHFHSTLPGLKQAGRPPGWNRKGAASGRHSRLWGASSLLWEKQRVGAPAPGLGSLSAGKQHTEVTQEVTQWLACPAPESPSLLWRKGHFAQSR